MNYYGNPAGVGGCGCGCNMGYGYQYDSTYKRSLFVNTGGVSEQNDFELEDYEVYTRDKLWFF